MPLQPGQLISARYRVIRILGQGGYGAVYLVEDTRLIGRTLALKESFDSSAEAETQFNLEARLLATLRHPSLPTVSDYFTERGGVRFLVMDYVEGRDLTDLIQQGIIAPPQAVQWMVEITDAVAYLHGQNPPIIHRDIKPSNIKIRPDNHAVLVDFGIAKVYNPQKQTARIAKGISTGFSPPEQYGGGSVASTHPYSDVYALGATLYCMVTRTVPPEALDILGQKARLIAPRQINPQVSAALEQVILRAMSLNALSRHQNARELAAALRAAMSGAAPFQPAATSSRVSCPRCAYQNRADAKFCSKCGHRFAAPAPAAPPAPAYAPPSVSVAPQFSPEMHFELGNAYARRKEYADAVSEYQQAAAAGFDNEALYFNWGDALIELDRESEAVKVLQRGIAKYPRDGDLHAELGWALARLKQSTAAIQALETAVKLSPQPFTYLLLALVYQDLGEPDKAIPHARKFVDAQSDSVFGHLTLGRLYLRANQNTAAQSEFERVLKLDGKNEAAHYLMSAVCQRAQKYNDAKNWGQKLIALAPKNPLGPYAVGLALMELKKWNDALKSMQESARLDPKDADTRVQIALCYLNLKKRDEAKRELREAARLDPHSQVIRDLLNQI